MKYIYANYIGDNKDGIPHGSGELVFDSPLDQLDEENLPSDVRVRFKGELNMGEIKSGFL
jgi:hypothetical protein